ncbi:histidinol dehydrogenase, partial [Candidatus Falkowbacteria bacterium]|nr:histidinol dehydrogenase [Candidatus Falkowbacteria bacterium]
MPQTLSTTEPGFATAFEALLSAKREDAPDVDATVAAIIADVRVRGDAALIEMTARFDRLDLTPETLAFSAAEIAAEVAKVSSADRAALELAAERIRAYHVRQMPADAIWTDPDGATLGWRFTPVSAAGLYVPGGLASYPSSVLMNAIPARVAGVGRLVIACPTPGGVVNPLVLAAAQIAGPSEILVIADADNNPDWIALDLLSQAEHDESAQSILITDSAD